ncbi:MAG: hypothetical protein HAW60_05065 [Bdellovibrionales bacterium]|nr:hypothetical protein [Bdellovibrionales bacterium]
MRSFLNRPKSFKKQSHRRSFFVLIFLLLAVIFLQKKLTSNLNKQELFWCNTRVVKLSVNKNIFVNKNFKWHLNKSILDSLFMERWLAKYCKLKILKVTKPIKIKSKKPLFCVTFVNKQKQCFYKISKTAFIWRGKIFLSPQLQSGFNKILFLTNKL